MSARLLKHPKAEAVFYNGSAHLQRVGAKTSLQELMHTLVSVHANKSDDEWSAIVEWLAQDSPESRAGWLLMQAIVDLERTARLAAMQGLEVGFELDLNELKVGEVHVTLTADGRKVREQLRGESDDGEVTA